MIIKIEEAGDANIRNFYPEEKINVSGVSEFTDVKSLRKSPLAETIFDIGGIESVLIASDMVSVRKKQTSDWEDLSPLIMAEIIDFIVLGAQAINVEQDCSDENLMKKIMGIIDARIRPALNKDGGDIEIKNFEDGILWVELTGRCSGCPYAMRTLKEGVEKILKNYIPQIKEVKPFGK